MRAQANEFVCLGVWLNVVSNSFELLESGADAIVGPDETPTWLFRAGTKHQTRLWRL